MNDNNSKRQGVTPGGMKININLNELDFCVCPNCGYGDFVPVKHLKRIPAMMTPTGQAGLAEIEIGFLCTHCGAVCPVNTILSSVAKELPTPIRITTVESEKEEA